MKILLTTLNSKYVHSNLALKYLYSVMADSDFDLEIKEFTINNNDDYIFTELVRLNYDIVCFSCYIWNIEKIKDIVDNLKKARPEIKILLGGPEVSYLSEEFMKENPAVDFIIKGEGELPFFQFCKAIYLEQQNFADVDALVYRLGDKIIENKIGPMIDWEAIPFPYQILDCESDKVLYYESSRGCPFGCTYCLSSIEKNVRTLSFDRVKRDLGYFIDKEVKQVKFLDRTFNYDKERAYKIWEFLINRDNGKTNFHFEICGDLIDDEVLVLLKKARKGLFQFEIGIQSANPIALKAVNRNENIYPILYNVEKLLDLANSHIHVDLIAGLPYEGYDSFGRSFNKIYELQPDNLQLGFLKLLKGTIIREDAAKYGYKFRKQAPYEVISNKYMSSVDIIKLKMIENVLELFYNRGGFFYALPQLEDAVSRTSFNFYEQLADFYYSNGYQHKSHKKEDLYRILLKFAESRENRFPGVTLATKENLIADLDETMNMDAVKKFNNKGWDIE